MSEGVQSGEVPSVKDAPVSPGDILAGKYRVEQVLGVGGMGVVVAATHVELRERRAIKFMLPAQLDNVEAVERFLREARASSRLKGEHVAKVHDVGRLENGAPYLVMEYLTGRDLRRQLELRGALTVSDAARYLLQVCEALAEAHGAGIVHRDLKPENLFLTKRPDGTRSIKVLDFGISKMAGATSDLAVTSTQAIMGSPYFMSPEQLHSSRDVDARTDIWSLGVILYQLVTNNLPFGGENLTGIIASVIYGKYPPASMIKTDVPRALDAVVARCLEADLDRRYPSVAALAADLAPFAPEAARQSLPRIDGLLQSARAVSAEEGPPSSAAAPFSTDPRVRRVVPRTRLSRVSGASVALGVALAAAIAVAAFAFGKRAPEGRNGGAAHPEAATTASGDATTAASAQPVVAPVSAAPATVVPPAPPASAEPSARTPRPLGSGKWPPRPAASSGPSPPPPPPPPGGNPFGAGRQ